MPRSSVDQRATELLSFEVRGQAYCVHIECVREIRGWASVTPVPHSPRHLRGLLTLRGVVIPIIDLGLKFGATEEMTTSRSAIIVIEHNDEPAGLLVDAVSGIISVDTAEIRPPPSICSFDADWIISGIVTVNEQMMSLVRISAIFAEHATPMAAE